MRVSFLFLPPPFHGLFPGGSALDSKLIGLSSTVDGHCVVCSGKTRASHCVSGMNIGELSWKHDKMLGRIGEGVGGGFACAALTSHPGGVGVHVLLITLINDKLLKLRQDELNLATLLTLPYWVLANL